MIDLLSKKEEVYGNEYKNHLFGQYQLYVDGMEKISDRRQQTNNYFISINTALISLIGLSFQIKIFEGNLWIRSILALVGIIICVIFWYLLRSYKQINTGKFAVIHKLEESLPVALYKYEWEVLGKGEDKQKYYPFSHIELYIPWVFGIIYLLLGLYFLC